jgi:hypothetical protein
MDEIRFKGGSKPGGGGFATPHVAGVPEVEPEGEVNDSLGSIHPADTMDTDAGEHSEAGDAGDKERHNVGVE